MNSNNSTSSVPTESLALTVGVVFRNESLRIPVLLQSLQESMPVNVSYELIGFDNDSDDGSSDTFAVCAEKMKVPYRILKSDRNSMANGRNEILVASKNELIYFVDSDVKVNAQGMAALLLCFSKTSHDSKICAWSGPLLITAHNDFQNLLGALQGHWLGNFGSAQMKKNIFEDTVSHSPTANLLIRRHPYLEVGSFDQRLEKAGEDLEIHLRLGKAGYKIRWEAKAQVEHDIAQDWRTWFRKCTKYGLAQTQIAKISPEIWFSKRCLPLWIFLLTFGLALTRPSLAAGLVLFYLVLIFLTALCLEARNSLKISALLVLTHFSYLLGEILGVFRKLETSTIKR